MKYFLGCLVRFALRLRYRVQIDGMERLAGLRGTLVLPNHPAQIDPAILVSFFWHKIQLRPMVLEKYYYLPGITWLMRVLRAVPVPDMEAGSGHFKRRRVELALKTAIESLKSGGNVLMYPAGRIMTSGKERLGGASGVSTLLRAAPDANVVLVRTRGLFGSSFSRAQSGSVSPNFPRVLAAGLAMALKNLLFFVPKREVSITIEVNPPGLPRKAEPSGLNRWLEEWYNRPGEEAISLVSRSAWKEDLPIPAKTIQPTISLGDVPPEVKTKVLQKLSELSTVPVSKIQPEMTLGESLGLDSLAVASLLSWLDEQFAATDVELAELKTVASLMQAAAGGSLGSAPPAQEPEAPPAWNLSRPGRPNAALAPGATIPLAFLRTAKRMGLHVAMADETSGVFSWRKLEVAVYLSAAELAKLPGQRV